MSFLRLLIRQVKIAFARLIGPVLGERAALWKSGGAAEAITLSEPEDQTTIAIERGTTVWWYGAVYDHQRRIIDDLACHDWSQPIEADHLIDPLRRLPPLRTLPGTAALMTSMHAQIYYHWMIDIVPKIDQFMAEGIAADHYLVCNELPFQKEINLLYGLPQDRIIHPPPSDCHMRFDRIIAVKPARNHLGAYPARMSTLRERLLGADTPTTARGRKLYVARGETLTRRVLDEAEVIDAMRMRGFDIVLGSKMTIAQQAKIFSEADLVVGPHGAGMTNLMFCAPGTRFMEFMPSGYYHPGFRRIAEVNALDYGIIEVPSQGGWKHDIDLAQSGILEF